MRKLLFVLGAILILGCQEKVEQVQTIDLEKEKEAIIAVIDRETETYYERRFEDWKNTYVHESYNMRMGYWEGYDRGIQYAKGWDDLLIMKTPRFERTTSDEWDNSTQDRNITAIRIYPEVAWLTYEQKDYEAGTKELLGEAIGSVILEKQDGEWKIAYIGYFYYPLEEEGDSNPGT